jgi:alpha-glucosidase (family GH31 glycosyl hydrolase)
LDTPEAFSCSDQFFVGDKLLVAPVVCQGARTRDVFIPKGSWRDQSGKIVTGPIKLNVKVSCTKLISVFIFVLGTFGSAAIL